MIKYFLDYECSSGMLFECRLGHLWLNLNLAEII
jgi:hypothetical protein